MVADRMGWNGYSIILNEAMRRLAPLDLSQRIWAASIEARRRTAQAQAQAIINHETDGVSTLPWVIIRETAIASNTCPVVYVPQPSTSREE
jgi:hypothetical protein